MNKYEKIYLKAEEKRGHASWIDTAIASLAVDIEEATGEKAEVSGPFGLRAEVIITTDSKLIVLTPDFSDGFRLHYDTGKTSGAYQPNTLGDWNGFNNITAPLPDTLEEIVQLMTTRHKVEL